MGVALDDAAARNALRAAADRAASLIESIDDRNRPVPGLNWSVCDTARHIVIAVRGNVASMNGDTSSLLEHVADAQDYSARMGAMTSGTLAAEPEHDPKTIGELLRSSVDAFLAEAVTRAPDDAVPTPWYGDGASLPVSIDTRLMLAEVVIHGLDIARGLGRPWPISKQEALLILPS
ncbi:MAG TPA: maleylpyruvate isomerase N-terminal domain-containing protein, partial [Solirubrobacteraceae bacterium]